MGGLRWEECNSRQVVQLWLATTTALVGAWECARVQCSSSLVVLLRRRLCEHKAALRISVGELEALVVRRERVRRRREQIPAARGTVDLGRGYGSWHSLGGARRAAAEHGDERLDLRGLRGHLEEGYGEGVL